MSEPTPEQTDDEVRHYIAATDLGRLHAKIAGPFDGDSWEPLPMGGNAALYRVDETTAQSFSAMDDEDDE